MTADQSLYVKLLNNGNIYQIDAFFSGNINMKIRSIRKSGILLQKVMFDKNRQLILELINKCPCKTVSYSL